MEKFHSILTSEFERRRIRNNRYSLRAYARDLEMSPSRLSEFLAAKANPRPSTALRILEKLSVDADLIESVVEKIKSSNVNDWNGSNTRTESFVVPKPIWNQCRTILQDSSRHIDRDDEYVCVTLAICTPSGLKTLVRGHYEQK